MTTPVRRGGLALFASLLLAMTAWPAAPARPAAPYFPPRHPDWEHRAPAQAGLDAARLQEAVALAHVTKAPHPPDDGLVQALRPRVALEDAPIDKAQHVEALLLGVLVEEAHLRRPDGADRFGQPPLHGIAGDLAHGRGQRHRNPEQGEVHP